jgi:hypothetical protein
MLGFGSTLEDGVASWWFIGCALGGLVFIVMGARAAGLALSAAVVGAIVGAFVVASDIDQLANGAMVGATIGAFAGGVSGLAWRSSASAITLGVLGSVTILVGVVCVLAGWAVTQRPCGPRVAPCLPEAEGMGLVWFGIDAAWIAGLCFIQAAQSYRSQLRHEPDADQLVRD